MKQQTILLFLFLLAASGLYGQQVQIVFPQMAEKEVKLYYFSGAQVDSVTARTDKKGRAVLKIPEAGYRGMAFLKAADAGGIEIVVAGKETKIACPAEELSMEQVDFSESEENMFLQRIFTTQSRNLQRQAWLQAAERFYNAGDFFLKTVQTELKTVEQSIEALQTETGHSPLYAARYYELNLFMNRLFEADQQADPNKALSLRWEMETDLDLASLYRTGQLWGSVHNYYISLFNRIDIPNKRREYVQSVLRTLGRLQSPLYEAYLAGSVFETERFGWLDARDSILTRTLDEKPHFKPAIPSLKQSVEAFLMRSKKIAPGIAGLSPQKGYEKMLVAFHDTDCNTCVNEMNTLARSYEALKKNKIRVISIAADKNAERFEAGTRDFPWPDKLCDLKGFEGENFKAFGTVATPTFFVISKDGIIENEYHSADEVIAGLTRNPMIMAE
jgi:peroxiredoxin